MRTDPRGSAAGRRQAKLGVFPLLVKLPNERVEKILKKERDAVSTRTLGAALPRHLSWASI